jgi:hypothetical protein
MKNLLNLLFFCFFSLSAFAQKNFVSHRGENWVWKDTGWVVKSEMKELKIPLSINNNFLIINNDAITYILLSREKTKISGDNYVGIRCTAVDLITEEQYYVDLVEYTDRDESVVSVTCLRLDINTRYFYSKNKSNE